MGPKTEALLAMTRAGTTEQRTAMRARIILRAADGAAQAQRHPQPVRALEVATGLVTNRARERHTGDDFLGFLRLLARTYPKAEVHLVLDN